MYEKRLLPYAQKWQKKGRDCAFFLSSAVHEAKGEGERSPMLFWKHSDFFAIQSSHSHTYQFFRPHVEICDLYLVRQDS